MTNDDFDPDFRGKFLQTIVDTYGPEISLDAGTVLVQEVEEFQTFFQLESAYTYKRNPYKPNPPMPILKGSAVTNRGEKLQKVEYCLAQRVRVPSSYEIEWYNSQETV